MLGLLLCFSSQDGNVHCPVNEEYVNCLNFCKKCFVPEYCRTPYCSPGCDCKPGYYRNSYGQCVTEEQCLAEEYSLQQPCGLNEVYTSCVNPCNDCYSRGRCNDYLYDHCASGCDCKPGFFRNDNGICIIEWNCLRPKPLPCPSGEIFYQCVPTCGTTCRSLYSPRGLCSPECKQGCFCQPGYVRNDDGVCVPPSECPFVCRPNEEFRTCGSGCSVTCENYRERKICSQQRCLRGCFCKAGFVLGPNGTCIRPRNCPDYKPVPCCGGLRGRSGNGTDDDDDDEDTTPTTNTTTTPAVTELSTENADVLVTSAAKSSETTQKVSEKITSESTNATTTLKSAGSAVETITLKSAGETTVLKSADETTLISAIETTLKSAVETTPKPAAGATTLKSLVARISKSEMKTVDSELTLTTRSPELSVDTTTGMAKMTVDESKVEPTDLTASATDIPALNVTKADISNSVSTLSGLSN